MPGRNLRRYRKTDIAVAETRRLLEPGPVVLVSSAWKGKRNIMTMGWHMIMETAPALVGCYIWEENHSHDMIRRSRACVINVPTSDLIRHTVGIGNCSGRDTDKFATFGLTPLPAAEVAAPLIGECHASFECRLVDARQIRRYNLFILEVVRAHVAVAPKFPRTVHYRGAGRFMVSGREIDMRRHFKPHML